jgi:hypothetical protein
MLWTLSCLEPWTLRTLMEPHHFLVQPSPLKDEWLANCLTTWGFMAHAKKKFNNRTN